MQNAGLPGAAELRSQINITLSYPRLILLVFSVHLSDAYSTASPLKSLRS